MAEAEINATNPESIRRNAEAGGIIYVTKEGEMMSTPAVFGSSCSINSDCSWGPMSSLDSIPVDATIILDWHTHGGETGFGRFGLDDVIMTNGVASNPGYIGSMLGTAEGNLWFYRAGRYPVPQMERSSLEAVFYRQIRHYQTNMGTARTKQGE